MGVLGSFIRFKVDFSAGSSSLAPAENGQFTESRTVGVTAPLGYLSQHIFGMKKTGGTWSTRERGVCTIHWINLTSGEVDTSWITADFTSVESAFETFWGAVGSGIPNDFRLEEHRWYGFGSGVAAPNPPARITTLATPLVGTGTATSPHQLATTVTLRTALRRHWGRFYLPISASWLAAGGELPQASVDPIAAAARTMLTVTPAAQGVTPVVYDRARKIAFGVTAIEVDSVPDIIRRRRPRDTTYRKIYTS
jgi:hypothetical protein